MIKIKYHVGPAILDYESVAKLYDEAIKNIDGFAEKMHQIIFQIIKQNISEQAKENDPLLSRIPSCPEVMGFKNQNEFDNHGKAIAIKLANQFKEIFHETLISYTEIKS